MATKSITIEEDAYNMLKSWKERNESFSDVVRKLASRPKLTDFVGLLRGEQGERLEKVIREKRAASRKRAVRRFRELQ